MESPHEKWPQRQNKQIKTVDGNNSYECNMFFNSCFISRFFVQHKIQMNYFVEKNIQSS